MQQDLAAQRLLAYDNGILSADNYTNIFEQDLAEADNSIIISSPAITADKIERFIQILKPRQEAGVKVSVILTNPENRCYGNADFYLNLTENMLELEKCSFDFKGF